jgi:hypothetical protein
LIHGKPVVGNLQIEVAVANGRLFQPLFEGLRAGGRDVMLHRTLDESAALPWRRHAVNGADRFLR